MDFDFWSDQLRPLQCGRRSGGIRLHLKQNLLSTPTSAASSLEKSFRYKTAQIELCVQLVQNFHNLLALFRRLLSLNLKPRCNT